MAKILSPEEMKAYSSQPVNSEPMQQQEGWAPWAGRMGVVAAERGLESLASVPFLGAHAGALTQPNKYLEIEDLEGLTPQAQKLGREKISKMEPVKTGYVPSPDIRESLSQYLPKDYLKTGEGWGYDLLERIGSDLPWVAYGILSGGSGFVPAAVGSITRALGGQAGNVVGGPVGDFVGSLAASGIYDTIRKVSPDKIVPYMETRVNELYDSSKEAASKLNASSKPFEKSLEKEMTRLYGPASGLKKTLREELQGELGAMYPIMKGNNLNLGQAIEQVQHYNQLLGSQKNRIAKAYYKRIVGALNETIDRETKKQSPELFHNYNLAKSTWNVLRDSDLASDTFKQATEKVGKFKSIPFQKAVKAAKQVPIVLTDVGRLFSPATTPLFKQSPVAREKLYQVMKESLGGNVEGVTRNLKKLDAILSKQESSKGSKSTGRVLEPGSF